VHAANAYATLARGGIIRDATLIADSSRSDRPRRCADLNLNSPTVAAALEGLRQSIEERYGTGNHIKYESDSEPIINAQGVTVRAKTGTAQAPPMRIDSNNDGTLDEDDAAIKDLDHSWFVGLVGPKGAAAPLHAIAVIVEYGGSGGRCAGPIANQIIRALQAEGYLPGDAAAPAFDQSHADGGGPEHEGEH
jgi:penicillin-binding protein 2